MSVTDPWSERAQLYRDSKAHSQGADLDLVVEWASRARLAIDVATGGGHVAGGCAKPGSRSSVATLRREWPPDVICYAEDLPFADGSWSSR